MRFAKISWAPRLLLAGRGLREKGGCVSRGSAVQRPCECGTSRARGGSLEHVLQPLPAFTACGVVRPSALYLQSRNICTVKNLLKSPPDCDCLWADCSRAGDICIPCTDLTESFGERGCFPSRTSGCVRLAQKSLWTRVLIISMKRVHVLERGGVQSGIPGEASFLPS